MKIFEFYFNPKGLSEDKNKKKGDAVFESFCFEPENVYEKRLGSLYMVASLKNILPQNKKFLNSLSAFLKEKFYKSALSAEKSLKETLKSGNEYLEKIAKGGDVSWLGNLAFTVISIKNFEFNFAKTGSIKLFLLRKGHIIDIDQKLKFENIEPYPLKVFGNIVSGKLTDNDMVLVLSEEAAKLFQEKQILNEIAAIPYNPEKKSFTNEFDAKKLNSILDSKKEDLLKISGICLLIELSKEFLPKEKAVMARSKGLKKFSFKQAIIPILNKAKKLKEKIPEIKKPKAINKISKIKKIKPPRIGKLKIALKVPKTKFKLKLRTPTFRIKDLPGMKNKVIPIMLFIAFLFLGFSLFKNQESSKIQKYREEITVAEEKIDKAENYLLVGENNQNANEKASDLLMEAWDIVIPIFEKYDQLPKDLANKTDKLKETLSEKLYELNDMETVKNIDPIFQFNEEEYTPHRIAFFSNALYCFSPINENIFEIKGNEGNVININERFDFAAQMPGSLLLFSKPNKLGILQNNEIQIKTIEIPEETNINGVATYVSSLYLLDADNKDIIKYPYYSDLVWGDPRSWLKDDYSKNTFKAIGIDGSIWILNEENGLDEYFSGKLINSIKLNVFPEIKNITKIFASPNLPYLYLLEPTQGRIIVIDTSGNPVKQFQMENNNILDFTVSDNGSDIYLLNGLEIYKLTL